MRYLVGGSQPFYRFSLTNLLQTTVSWCVRGLKKRGKNIFSLNHKNYEKLKSLATVTNVTNNDKVDSKS